MIDKLKNFKAFNIACLIGVFIFTERSMRGMFLFSFSYRAMTVHDILMIACAWFVIIAFALRLLLKKYRIEKVKLIPLVMYLIIFAGYLLSTVINSGSIARWTDDLVYSFAAIAFLTLVDDKKTLYKVTSWIFIIIAALNILCEYVAPIKNYMAMWTEDYFLGFENAFNWPLVLGFMFNLLDYKYSKKLPKLIAYAVLFYMNQIMCFCATALIGSAIILVYLAFPFVRRIFEKWDFKIFLLIVLILFLVLVVFYEDITNISFVKFVVEDVLGKDITLSGRMYVWQGVLGEAVKKPLLGHGFGESTNYFYEPSRWNHGYVHAHNEWLNTFYEGGLLTLALGIAMLIVCTKHIKSKECKMILFAMLIMLQSDFIAYYPWYLVTFVCEVGIIEQQ